VEAFSFEAFLNCGIFAYVFLFICFSVVTVILSSIEINHYKKRNRYETLKPLLVSPFAPSVSVIVPVVNLQTSIIDTVRALFALQYNNFEIIVVNERSSDLSLIELTKFYQLQPAEYSALTHIKTQRIHRYYKSANPVFSKLTVVDKASGGRADALNAGINISKSDLVLCVDADCFLNQDSLLKLVKPFLEEKERVISASSVKYLANSSEKKDGHLIKLKFPKNLLAAFQAVEYLKKFVTERMAWSSINGIPLFSGTVTLFDKEVLIEAGAFNSEALRPDFELLIRMCRHMHDNSMSYKLAHIAESICRTEAPESLRVLGRERRTWNAGIFQALRLHKSLLFNSKYGRLGLLKIPVLALSLCLPYFTMFLLVLVVAGAFLSNLNWEFTGILLFTGYSFSVLMSVISVLYEERSFRSYSSGRDIVKMLLLGFVEPVIYQPLVLYWQITSSFGRRK
jgi:poly-beta-1,6-N-acetyl-D-glucosamine synthase